MTEGMKKKTPDNATTIDEDYHTNKKKQVSVPQPHTSRASTDSVDSEPQDDTTEPKPPRLRRATGKQPRRRQQPLLRLRAKRRTRRRTGAMGRLHYATQRTKQMICRQQMESRRGSSDRAGQTGKQATMIVKHHEGRWTKLFSNCNPAMSPKQKVYWKQGRPAKS